MLAMWASWMAFVRSVRSAVHAGPFFSRTRKTSPIRAVVGLRRRRRFGGHARRLPGDGLPAAAALHEGAGVQVRGRPLAAAPAPVVPTRRKATTAVSPYCWMRMSSAA